VRLLGYLGLQEYADAVASASVVLTLTTEPSSVMRSAYEAVYARVPLVTTDTPVLRETFPYAVHCGPTAADIAAAVRRALDGLDDLRAVSERAAAVQLARWDGQLAELREACDP
jgi:glycosyltransferase involved in cell wall biosynthesis